jgi:ABC-type sugar transport system ATPase subunit
MASAVLATTKSSTKLAIHISGLTKKYGHFFANTNIDIEVAAGEVHSLVGQNGAGKSTLLGILSGRTTPTSGNVMIFGHELHYGEPRSSSKLGIATIYQELTIAPNISALENVFMGQLISRNGFSSVTKMKERYKELCGVMGVDIPPMTIAGELSMADQQILEIMRGLYRDARILILDEPTASLDAPERKSLLRTIKSLRKKGITIIYVSHHLEEVLEISDNITVLKNGEKVATEPRDYWTKEAMVSAMMGKEMGLDIIQTIAEEASYDYALGEEVLRASHVTIPNVIDQINLTVRSGEIVGIGGLVGSGRTEFVRALSGLEPHSSGQMWMEGKQVKWPKNPRTSISYGIALSPEDRKHQGLVLGLSCQDNINMVNFGKVNKFGLYDTKSASSIATQLGDRFGLTRPIQTLCKNLSGGNQQKVLLSKVCNLKPKVLLVDEPTRGIDIGGKFEVLKILKKLANEGMAIVIISSELEEIVAVSDRVIVFSKGRLVKELNDKDEISVVNILHNAFQGGSS